MTVAVQKFTQVRDSAYEPITSRNIGSNAWCSELMSIRVRRHRCPVARERDVRRTAPNRGTLGIFEWFGAAAANEERQGAFCHAVPLEGCPYSVRLCKPSRKSVDSAEIRPAEESSTEVS